MSSWRITWRALSAVARKDAARDRLLSVFLWPWVLGSLALLVGTSWVPDWLWDVVGIARLRPSSPEVILRAWVCVGLAPAIWLGVRASVLSESRDGGWNLLRRLPLRPSLLLLGKAMHGLVLLSVLAGIGLLIAVTASSFGESSGPDTLAAAAGLAGAISTLYAICFLSALLGRHRLLVWSGVASLYVSSGARLEELPGGALFRLPLGPDLLEAGLTSAAIALVGLFVLTALAGLQEGRWLALGEGDLRSVDLSRAAALLLVFLTPWALTRTPLPPVQLAGPVLRGPAPNELEVEELASPAGQTASRALVAALTNDLVWLRDLGLDPPPLAVASAPELAPKRSRQRPTLGARGVLLEANFGDPAFATRALRADALRALLERRPGWGTGAARLLGLGLPELRAQPLRPSDSLWAAWALERIEGDPLPWIERWDALERRVGRIPARALARALLEDYEAREPGGPEAWAAALAQAPRSAPPEALVEGSGLSAWTARLSAAERTPLGQLPRLEAISVEPVAGGLRYRARISSPIDTRGGAAALTSARLVLRTVRSGTRQIARGEALLGAPGFGEVQDWASLELGPGEVRWQLGLALPAGEGVLVFAAGEESVR